MNVLQLRENCVVSAASIAQAKSILFRAIPGNAKIREPFLKYLQILLYVNYILSTRKMFKGKSLILLKFFVEINGKPLSLGILQNVDC